MNYYDIVKIFSGIYLIMISSLAGLCFIMIFLAINTFLIPYGDNSHIIFSISFMALPIFGLLYYFTTEELKEKATTTKVAIKERMK